MFAKRMTVGRWNEEAQTMIVTHYYKDGREETLSAEESRKHWKRSHAGIMVVSVLFLPVTVVFQVLVKIHNGIEWLLSKFMA